MKIKNKHNTLMPRNLLKHYTHPHDDHYNDDHDQQQDDECDNPQGKSGLHGETHTIHLFVIGLFTGRGFDRGDSW